MWLRQSPVRFFSRKQNQYFPNLTQTQKIKRFYKKVAVVEHPLNSSAQLLAPEAKVTFENLSQSHKYFAVTLDDKVVKTTYKDDLLIPSRALAVALAEEWEAQQEVLNLRSLQLHNMLSRCIRVKEDESIQDYMKEELFVILENDEICYREYDRGGFQESYKSELARLQEEKTAKVFQIMQEEFGIKLKVFKQASYEQQDKSVQKIVPILSKLDPVVLSCLFQVAAQAKSTAVALALLYKPEVVGVQEAVEISRLDVNYQTKVFGKVEGAHDLDEAAALNTIATAKTVVNLCELRDF